ncbi:glycosyltransferase family 2 protein [Hazenella sp. IB182357]|uniref:Glycosyltransferase family 2 protein n=1 Tax=Polycladospora coralii TaxID=2771432 RepID=A0A926N744_9BACL|nr:glycosyltransferase family A protein [Polycladospora coralii]MBD1371151.1 glycosyltransferase family 2 protein [Polycladospora coralii]MBS7530093.1 glycosyltransferase family 2 protein [Polycladospora coralii]
MTIAYTNGVSIILCTNKPFLIRNAIANFLRVKFSEKEMHVIVNHDSPEFLDSWRNFSSGYENIHVHKAPDNFSLGHCLNYGVTLCKYNYIAKFDDDDYYGPSYLQNSMQEFRNTNVDIVARRWYYLYFIERNELYLDYHNLMRGGTLMFRRWVNSEIPFQDISLGEDITFVQEAMDRGISIKGLDHRDFVYVRNDNLQHTWRASFEEITGSSTFVAHTRNYVPFVK